MHLPAACLEKPEGQLTEPMVLQGGRGDPAPTAKPRVTDTLISLVFPALRCNQARSNLELSICYPGRQREGARGPGEQEGEGTEFGKPSQAKTPGPQPRLMARLHSLCGTEDHALTRAWSRQASFHLQNVSRIMVPRAADLEATVMVLPLTSCVILALILHLSGSQFPHL